MYDFKSDFRKGWIPNLITFTGLAMVPPIILAHAAGYLLMATGYFVLAWVCDWADGFIARKYKMQSMFGEFFDPLADKGFTWGMIIYFWDRVPHTAAYMIMGFGLLATIGRVIIVAANRNLPVSIDVMAGMAGKLKTNFEKSGLVAILLADVSRSYLGHDIVAETIFNADFVGKFFETLSLLGLWLSIPLAFVSFLSIVMKLKRLAAES